MNDQIMVLQKFYDSSADRKTKMAATAGHGLIKNPMEKIANNFYGETVCHIDWSLCMNDQIMVLHKFYDLSAYRKSKMAATVEHSLTLNPMGKNANYFYWETVFF